jgi:hypothetical protein
MEKVDFSVIQNIVFELPVQYSLLGFNTDASKAKNRYGTVFYQSRGFQEQPRGFQENCEKVRDNREEIPIFWTISSVVDP